MAHNNDSTPPTYYNPSPYPAWPPVPPQPYTIPQPMNMLPPQPAQSSALPGLALPPELQNLNLTPHQLAALFSHFQAQAGLVTLPPPPPPPNFPFAAALPVSAPHNAFPVPASQYPTQGQPDQGYSTSHLGTAAVPSHDLEEGELSDVASRPHSEPSVPGKKRKLSAAKQEERLVSQRSSAYNGLSTNGQGHGHPRPQTADNRPSGTESEALEVKKARAIKFLEVLHQEGYTYDQLVQEGLDAALLRRTFEELHLPISPPTTSLPLAPVQQVSAIATSQPSLSVAQPKTRKPEPVKVPATKPAAPAPVDRQSYLARLQAAKNKKPAAPNLKPNTTTNIINHNATPTKTKPTTDAPPATSVIVAATGTAPDQPAMQHPTQQDAQKSSLPSRSGPPKAQPASKSSDAATELVRKKMEALKSMKRRLAAQPPASSPAPSQTVPLATLPSAITSSKPDDPATASDQATANNNATAPPKASSFGIPGLFMSEAVSVASATTTPSSTPSGPSGFPVPTNPAAQDSLDRLISETSSAAPETMAEATTKSRRRPVAADLNEAPTPPEVPVYKRPFGRSRRNSSDDAMIIEVSDDEGATGDGDLTVRHIPSMPFEMPSVRQKSIRDLPPLRDFPQRTSVNKAGIFQGSGSTPVGTPGTAHEMEELQRKEVELNALKAKIQELERRKKAAKAKAQAEQDLADNIASAKSVVSSAPGTAPSSLPGLGLVTAQSSQANARLEADITASDVALTTRRTQMMELQRQMAVLEQHRGSDEQEKEDTNAQAALSRPEASNQTVDKPVGGGEQSSEQNSSSEEGQITDGSFEMYDSEAAVKSPLASQTGDNDAAVLGEPRLEETDQLRVQETQTSSDVDLGSSMSESSDSDDHLTQPAQSSVAAPAEDQDSSMDTDSSSAEMSTSDTSSDDSDDEAASPSASAGEESEDVEMDLDESSSDEIEHEPTPAQLHAITVPDVQIQGADTANVSLTDNTVQGQRANQGQLDFDAPLSQDDGSVTMPQFRPYESPLKMFKKYRFHPDYLQNVSGGFASLTYTHNIKSDVPLCRSEFAGGLCHDQSCDGQHWRDMVLQDDLMFLRFAIGHSSPPFRPGNTGSKEEMDRWMLGLKEAIHDNARAHPGTSEAQKLERTKSLPARIVQYRREWLKDPTIIVSQ